MSGFNFDTFYNIDRTIVELKDGKREYVGYSMNTLETILREYCGNDFAVWLLNLLDYLADEIDLLADETDHNEEKAARADGEYTYIRGILEEVVERLDEMVLLNKVTEEGVKKIVEDAKLQL